MRFINKKRAIKNLPLFKPLYNADDVRKALPQFKIHDYESTFEILDGVKVHFTDAGHIIGSASVHLDIEEQGTTKKITFSGDVGKYNNAILNSPKPFRQADVIICESTYGDSLHDEKSILAQQLLDMITETCLIKKGKLIIPAFSVGRTQELLYVLSQLDVQGKLPYLNYYVDSPLSTDATLILKKHSDFFNNKLKKAMQNDKDPFDFRGLEFVMDKIESQHLNNSTKPSVVISASGMAEAGRVKHHIAHAITEPKNTILMVGYCEPNSLGGKLMRGDKKVRIFGEEYDVNADVQIIRSLSAHGDYEDLCQFLSCQDEKAVDKFFVVHGEPKTQFNFQKRLLKKGFTEVIVPQLHQEIYI
jgi:metallo-beta-lactamase family protein